MGDNEFDTVWGRAFDANPKEQEKKKKIFQQQLERALKHFSQDLDNLEDLTQPFLQYSTEHGILPPAQSPILPKTFPQFIQEILDEYGVVASNEQGALYPLDTVFQMLQVELETGEFMSITTEVAEAAQDRYQITAIEVFIDLRNSLEFREGDHGVLHIQFPYEFSTTDDKNLELYYVNSASSVDESQRDIPEPGDEGGSLTDTFDSEWDGMYYLEENECIFCLEFSAALQVMIHLLQRYLDEVR